MIDNYNPLRTVNNVELPTPSSYVWKEEDISANDAGRTEDLVMNKKRIGQIVGLELSWNNVSIKDASIILKAFDPEYVDICYLDAKQGIWVTSSFYTGNRNTPLYNAKLGVWSKISFNVIQRAGVTNV